MTTLEEPDRATLNALLQRLLREPKSKDVLDAIARVRTQLKALK
jgi:hypothetical protein